jgi:hypothetical protein
VIRKPFERIEKADIEALVNNGVREGRTLEYKQALQVNSDDEKREFLMDISSFANASGGDILYGIEECRDEHGKATGIPEKATGLEGVNVDQEVLRLDNLIRDGVQPRIAGIRIHPVALFSDRPILLIRIPKSYAAPHMVIFRNLSRFYARNSAGKYQLDISEIRSAFALSETLPERVRRFRDDRLARIVASETPAPLQEGAKLVLHVLPISALDPTSHVDLERIDTQIGALPPLRSNGYDYRFNFDGFLTHYTDSNPRICYSYLQLFRGGAIEAVTSEILHNKDGGRLFPTGAVERELITAMEVYLHAYKGLQIEPPIIVMISLIGVRGYFIMAVQGNDQRDSFDRDALLLPDLMIEDPSVSVETLLKPAFDAMWQASGWPRCFNYDVKGRRVNSDRLRNLPR